MKLPSFRPTPQVDKRMESVGGDTRNVAIPAGKHRNDQRNLFGHQSFYTQREAKTSAKNPYQEPDAFFTRPQKKTTRTYRGPPGGPGDPRSADKPEKGTLARKIIDERITLIRSHHYQILNSSKPIILPAKIYEYILSSDHPSGGPKARLFEKVGFITRPSVVDWEKDSVFRKSGQALMVSLAKALSCFPGTFIADTKRGVKFEVILEIKAPNGSLIFIETA